MKLYLSTITTAIVIISAANILFHTAQWYYVILAVVWCTALQFALDALIALLINKMPDRWFETDSAFFCVTETEKKLYQKLNVRQWKDKVWELGGLGGFSKKNLKEPNNPQHIKKFILECNKGVVTHRLSYPIGFLAMLTLLNPCSYTIALPVAIINLYLNILPTIVLRYNTPKLKALLRRLEKGSV